MSAAAFGTFGIIFALGGGFPFAVACFVMMALDMRAYHRGWAISYELPPHGKIQIARPGLSGDVARRAWARTQEAAKDPNRQRYAFVKGTKQ